MRHHARTSLVLMLCVGSAVATPRVARDQPGGLGSAIALEYTAQHDVMRPGETVSLLLCLTNQNPESTRDVQTSDSFAFTFASGGLGSCGPVSVISPGGDLHPSDFDCVVDGQTMRLTRITPTAEWPALDSVCARVPFVVPASSTRAAASMDVANLGAFRAPAPAAVLLNVGDDLGSVGPVGATGPEGPAGPLGPPGLAAVGASAMALSTDIAYARQNEPPSPAPGLDVTLDISERSKIEILLDTVHYFCDSGALAGRENPVVLIEVDGAIVAQRIGTLDNGVLGQVHVGDLTVAWLGGVLSAGSHRVRVLVDVDEDGPGDAGFSRCVGSGTDERLQSRLIVKEIRSAP